MRVQEDIRGAEEFVKGEITRLLSGRCETWEMVMTGGLWRVTGQQVASAAEGTAAPDGEEVRGPHASLAVRLQVLTFPLPPPPPSSPPLSHSHTRDKHLKRACGCTCGPEHDCCR